MGTKQNGTSYAKDDILSYMDILVYCTKTLVLPRFQNLFIFFKLMFKEASWIFSPPGDFTLCIFCIIHLNSGFI